MVSVYSSTSGIGSTNTINRNDRMQNQHSTSVSSGKKINKASDDAAGLAISSILSSDVSTLKQSASNLVQGTSVLQTADGALEQAGNILNRMQQLATQANSGSVDANSRNAINEEYQGLKNELNDLGQSTNFNGQKLLDGSFNQTFQAGTDGSDFISADLSSLDLSASSLGLTAMYGASASALTTQSSAQATAGELETAINNLSAYRAQTGAIASEFSTRGDAIQTTIENNQAAESSIIDVDIGRAQTEFQNSKVLSDLAIASAAQGNKISTSLLQLVR